MSGSRNTAHIFSPTAGKKSATESSKRQVENVVSAENPPPRYITRPTNDAAGKKMLTSPLSVITATLCPTASMAKRKEGRSEAKNPNLA